MTSPEQKNLPVFNLLSIGQRGVGKTVFLAGSYTDLKNPTHSSRSMWFECLEGQDQTNLETILGYIAQTGEYPPPTMKITDFNFVVNQRNPSEAVTPLCQFHWWDIPGEYATFDHSDFQKMVLSSHSCCVFINAARLVKDPEYRQELVMVIRQVTAIASVVNPAGLNYNFALIFTQCDRLDPGPMSRLQIEQYLQPLNKALESAHVKFQRFYSSIPIITEQGTTQLKAAGTADVFLWLITELLEGKSYKTVENAITPPKTPPRPKVITKVNHRPILLLITGSLALLGITTALLFGLGVLKFGENTVSSSDSQVNQYLKAIKNNPNDFDSLVKLSTRYLELEDLKSAIPVMEEIVKQKPDQLLWKLNLARIYELDQQSKKAESIYDQILAQDKNSIQALIGKAMIRKSQGDNTTAQQLFKRAEQIAPSQDLKERIRKMAQSKN